MTVSIAAQEWEQRKLTRIRCGGIICWWLAGYVWFR